MGMFTNKQKKVEKLLTDYCQTVMNCLNAFRDSIVDYENNPKNSYELFKKVHEHESKADDIRREVEVMMYSKALFPESRGDILGLLEAMDKVPNQAESAVHAIKNQHIVIPEEYQSGINELVDLCVRTGAAMVDSVEKLFSDYTSATVAVGKIDELESAADKVEAKLIERIFAAKPKSIQAILLRDLIKQIAAISDRAENAGDRIRIAVAKRMI